MKKLLILFLFIPLLGSADTYTLKEGVRGVWVPDPQYTNVLKSYQNVIRFVEMLDSLNLNSVFVVSYAQCKTIYPSRVLLTHTNYASIDSTNMLQPFMSGYNNPRKSPMSDPVQDLITEAHKRGIKVFFWYEFGFMANIKPATVLNNPILAKHPNWLGIGNDGKPSNYNNQDYYFNAFNPEVQNYILQLIIEGIKRYPNVDGIQGDDRLPAMCINSGYDPITINRYKAEHNGSIPPSNFKDSAWVRWRLDILNQFGKTLYKKVKSANPKVMVSFAPNPYPWSKDNLMQEWPEWVSSGMCDLLAVQCYRNDSISYRKTVTQAQSYFKPKKGKKQLFAPGILMMVGGKMSDAQQIKTQILINRDLKTNGEIFFYNEGLHRSQIRAVLKELYPQKAVFPKIK